MTLNVAIATWQADGIRRVAAMELPEVAGVSYVISWQAHADATIPESLSSRSDIAIHRFDRAGVSANRNNALSHCSADIILMADDDLRYTAGQLLRVIEVFENNPEVDIATFRYLGSNQKYPAGETDLKLPLPKGFSASLITIACRRDSLNGLTFDEQFGPGAPVWQAAEDEKFLFDAISRGLRCRFFPIDITAHPNASTGSRPITSAGVAAASGRMIRLLYPLSFPLRIVLKAWRQHRIGGDFFFVLRNAFRGALQSSRHY